MLSTLITELAALRWLHRWSASRQVGPGLLCRGDGPRGIFARTLGSTSNSFEARAADQSYSPQLSKRSRRLISFITDVEGDRQYLARYVRQSKVLRFLNVTPCLIQGGRSSSLYFPYDHCIDFQSDDGCLVFGGDVWDQGGSDLYVIRQLLHLQRRYPDRVHFVMGNRDINKMRISSELGEPGASLSPPHRGVFPLRSNSRDVGASSSAPPASETPELSRNPVERLQWILARTMGSPRAFEHRRWELSQERQLTGQADHFVTDDDVVESYRLSCHPRLGEVAEYLSKAKLVVRIGEALFLHGALPRAIGMEEQVRNHSDASLWSDLTPMMPWLKPGTTARDAGVASIEDWFRALNEFSKSRVEDWKSNNASVSDFWSTVGGYHHEAQPFSSLLQYGMGWLPRGVRNPSIVYSSWCTDGMPRRFYPNATEEDRLFVAQIAEFFEETGIRLICCGHQPQGDVPNVIRVMTREQSPAYVLCCDTSYSGDTMWYNAPSDARPRLSRGRETSRSGRGVHAVSEVLIEQCVSTGRLLEVCFHGTLCDGSHYEAEPLPLAFGKENARGSRLAVGTVTPTSAAPTSEPSKRGDTTWWTRAALKDGSFLVCTGEGFRIWDRIIHL